MGRGKLRLELVENEKTRAATFKKRIIGLKKKAEELTILCNVRICMVIFGPKLKDKPLKVDVWPSDRAQVKSMIHDCKTSTSQKRIFTMSDYLNLRQKKVEDEIAQVRRANFKARFPTWDVRIDNLSSDQLELLRSELDSKLEAAKIKLTAMKGIDQNHHHQAPHPQYTSDHLISAANFPPKNLSDNYLQSHNFPLKTPSPFDHQIQAIPQNSLDYGLFMGQHSGNQVQSNHLPMKINLNPFDHHNIYGFPQKNLDYNGLIMGQQSGNFVQSHHVPLKTTRNQFDHIQSFPHNKNYGLFMDPQPPQVSTLSQADENLLNLSLNLNVNKNRMNPMSIMNNNNNLDFNFQSGGASSNDHLDFNIVQQSGSRNMPNPVGYSPLGSSFSSHHHDHQGFPAAHHHDPMHHPMQDNDVQAAAEAIRCLVPSPIHATRSSGF